MYYFSFVQLKKYGFSNNIYSCLISRYACLIDFFVLVISTHKRQLLLNLSETEYGVKNAYIHDIKYFLANFALIVHFYSVNVTSCLFLLQYYTS